ncbi:MAG: nitrate reductase molybdenum cofactor assembly chaperone [Alphaproteobacteria bacterium]|nr:MAG: nitrate reductase molybdenum cofactor assembly chaperone [Alphaproteobacteria bacterium]
MKTFKILGLLLSYPKEELIGHLDDLMQVLELEKLLPARNLKKIKAFTEDLKAGGIYDLQESYVELFDRGRAHCLQLFEHIHGESRDRGMAMVNLAEAYEQKGFYVSKGELPDYLPLFLEFLSLCPLDEAMDFLGDPINVIAAIGVKLKKRGASYAAVFEAIEALSKVKPDQDMIALARAEPLENLTHDDIDKEWEEANAFDNSDVDSADCNTCNAFSGATEEIQNIANELRAGDQKNA